MRRQRPEYQTYIDLIYDHQGIVRRICAIYASSPEDREDLYQEILLQSWRSFASFSGQSRFSTWLYRVALNTALLRRRRESNKREVTLDRGTGADLAVDEDSKFDVDVELLHQCIRELPALNRAIILLHLERHTYEEIADITGLSRTNVSVRLVRIKDKLRQLLLAKRYRED